MKKYISVFLSFILVLSLCACGSKSSVKFQPKLGGAFTVNAQIMYGEQESAAVVKRLGMSSWDIEFSSPNTLAGVVLSYRENNVEASYKGLSFSVPKSALPLKAIILTLTDVVDSMSQLDEIECEEKDGSFIYEGENEQGKYVLEMDKNGGLSKFTMKNLNLEITFTDFTDNGAVTDSTTETLPSETTAETTAESIQSETEQTEASD